MSVRVSLCFWGQGVGDRGESSGLSGHLPKRCGLWESPWALMWGFLCWAAELPLSVG